VQGVRSPIPVLWKVRCEQCRYPHRVRTRGQLAEALPHGRAGYLAVRTPTLNQFPCDPPPCSSASACAEQTSKSADDELRLRASCVHSGRACPSPSHGPWNNDTCLLTNQHGPKQN
jgi:hypothetical protein